jgi:RNA polymerase primary sigma factor
MEKSIIKNTTEIQQYIKDIRKIPVISHERQDEIFKELKNKKTSTTEKNELYRELILGNLRFVISIAKSYQNQGMDIMDLISEGNIGLIKAAERFNPSNDVKFISYAVWWIRQSIMSSLNENARTIRLPSNIVQEVQKQKKKNQKTKLDTNNSYTVNENVDFTLPHCVALYNEINEDGDQLIDLIPNDNSDNPENSINNNDEIKKKVSLMLNVLDEREKTIIEKYFGLTGSESNLEDLGDEFGCTKERIRQLKDKAIKKLRNESFELLKYL